MLPSRERDRLTADLAAAGGRIAELEAELSRLASRDPIAGELLTLRAFRAEFELDVQRAHRYRRPLAVAVIDIDRFRYINLRHGYGAGDLVLGGVGAAIGRCARTHDVACRLGGDEFAVLFPETEPDGALDAVRRILASLAELDAGGVRGHSASAGVAALEPGQSPEALLAAAGSALERARAAGGGRATLYTGADGAEAEDEQVARMHGDAMAALAATMGARGRAAVADAESVVDIAAGIAALFALGPARLAVLRTAALLHDIGKVGIPDEVLHKPGALSDTEWQIVRQHPVIGERIIRAIPGMAPVAQIVRHEHERWDGNGYPDGLVGTEIPIEARIILAADAYHAVTSDRPYRTPLSDADAIEELTANAGTQFDPQVVDALADYLNGRRQSGLAAV